MAEKSSSSAWDALVGGGAIVAAAILIYKLLRGTPQQNVPRCPRCNYPLKTGIGNCPNCNLALRWV